MGLGLRNRAAQGLAKSGLARAASRLPGSRHRLMILAYHRVYDMGDEDAFPYDPELVSATPADFAWQMGQVKRHAHPLTFRDLQRYHEAGEPLPPRSVIVTFDDGHFDNYTEAFPILRDAGVPATLFVSTGYIGKPGTFWFDHVAHLFFTTATGALKLSAVPFEARLDGVSSRRAAAESLLGVLKRVPEATRQAALTELEARLGGAGEHADERRSGALTWDEVREMARGGIEIGSHAVTHPILTQLDDASLAAELSESRRAIESETGQEATTVAYPVGGLHAFDDRVMAASSAAGYRFGVSYLTGVNAWPEIEPYALKRLHVERYTSREYFQCMLVAPRFFS